MKYLALLFLTGLLGTLNAQKINVVHKLSNENTPNLFKLISNSPIKSLIVDNTSDGQHAIVYWGDKHLVLAEIDKQFNFTTTKYVELVDKPVDCLGAVKQRDGYRILMKYSSHLISIKLSDNGTDISKIALDDNERIRFYGVRDSAVVVVSHFAKSKILKVQEFDKGENPTICLLQTDQMPKEHRAYFSIDKFSQKDVMLSHKINEFGKNRGHNKVYIRDKSIVFVLDLPWKSQSHVVVFNFDGTTSFKKYYHSELKKIIGLKSLIYEDRMLAMIMTKKEFLLKIYNLNDSSVARHYSGQSQPLNIANSDFYRNSNLVYRKANASPAEVKDNFLKLITKYSTSMSDHILMKTTLY